MGNCNAKTVVNAIDISKDIIRKILEVERCEDESKSLLALLELLYSIDTLDKHNQKLVISLVEEKLKKSKVVLQSEEAEEQKTL